MEFFIRAKAVRLRSHHNKYLLADEDEETICQSRNGSSLQARWTVEFVDGDSHLIRLKSCFGKYLTATEEPYLFSISGRKVKQVIPLSQINGSMEWEPRSEGKLVKMKARGGLYLRANGSLPPWRNSVTHDIPHRAATQDWVLWDVDVVDILAVHTLPSNVSLSVSSLSSSFNDVSLGSERLLEDSAAMETAVPSRKFDDVNCWNAQGGMEFFQKAKSVRLRSHHDKYLLADDDQETVCQDRHGSIRQAKWTVEFVESTNTGDVIRLKSCYGKYLAASNEPFMLGMSGKKVFQTLPRRLDSSLEWEPIREGKRVRLKTRYGNFLRANGGLPPWRNSITHDIPHRSRTQDWILWEVDVVEIQTSPPKARPQQQPQLQPQPQPKPHSRSQSFSSEPDSPTSIVLPSPRFNKLEFHNSYAESPIKAEGRMIYYKVADENGSFDEGDEGLSFTFKSSRLEELVQKLEEETCLEDIIVCSQFKGKLYPLRLQLPPNNADMHVVVVPSASRGARDIVMPGNPASG